MKIWEWAGDVYHQIRWMDMLIAFGIMFVFFIINRLLVTYVFAFINKKFKAGEQTLMWRQAFEKPLRLFIVLLGVYLGLNYLLPPLWLTAIMLDRWFRSAVIILVGWGLLVLSNQSSFLLEEISKKIRLDDSSMLIPFLSKVLRFVVFVLIITLVASEWGFSINGVVAGMGLGSLALALAAKDTLGNIIGGIVIILEKPFSKGDWILTPSVEGFVDDITFRSTKIRTFADALVTVPNATLSGQPITNWSRMGKRRINFTLNVALDSDRLRLAAATERLERMLREDEKMDPATIMVKFTEFQESSLGIMFYFFTKTTVWAEYLKTRQEVNLMVLEVLEEEGIRLAYPSQRVLLEKMGEEDGEYKTLQSYSNAEY
ncbi:mechanosensitive ion channel family protein [Paenibacillus dokdonensis]|uniref:mechanosensitive ion channel family protein n=1 Tax=Paenibacillus dokdonensis TaxID=2567944 RepID=UPI001457DF15|nr:mechanosensitive ion channel family protein [Paenibacillus dokdonensis]